VLLDNLRGYVPSRPCEKKVRTASVMRVIAERTSPGLARLINNVYNVKLLGVLLFQRVKLFTEEDILFGHVGEQEREFSLVILVWESVV